MVSSRTPYPSTYTLYATILIHKGRGRGGELNQRAGKRSNREEYRSQSWVENTNMADRISSL
jgi:hypothetical protein